MSRAWILDGARTGTSEAALPPKTTANRDDLDLLAALRRGEPWAPKAFYERVRPAIDRTLRRLLGVKDGDYDDMVQNALVELVRAANGYRGDGSLEGWVGTVTARAVFRHIRERQAERAVVARTDGDAIAFVPQFEDGEAEAEARDLVLRVRAHLEAMDSRKSWTYLLHDVHGYTIDEIAEITDATPAAAQTRLVRARRELEERLEADGTLADALRRRG